MLYKSYGGGGFLSRLLYHKYTIIITPKTTMRIVSHTILDPLLVITTGGIVAVVVIVGITVVGTGVVETTCCDMCVGIVVIVVGCGFGVNVLLSPPFFLLDE